MLRKLFGTRSAPLPLYSNSVSSEPARRFKANPKTLMLALWIIISLVIVYFGYAHCRSNRIVSKLDCDKQSCVLQYQTAETGGKTHFPRERLIKSELIRVDNYKVVDPETVNSKKARRLGYSYNVIYETLVVNRGEEQYERFDSPLSVFGISRRKAKASQQVISDYKAKIVNEVKLEEGRFFTSLGSIMIFFGFLSIIVALCLFSSPDTIRRPKKRRA